MHNRSKYNKAVMSWSKTKHANKWLQWKQINHIFYLKPCPHRLHKVRAYLRSMASVVPVAVIPFDSKRVQTITNYQFWIQNRVYFAPRDPTLKPVQLVYCWSLNKSEIYFRLKLILALCRFKEYGASITTPDIKLLMNELNFCPSSATLGTRRGVG